MHKLMDFVCDELEELEHKADKNGELSMNELQYADMLAHLKKNLLKVDKMAGEDEFSYRYDDGRSYARKRDAMGRYSRRYSMANDEMVEKLRDMMDDAPDEMTRKEFDKFIHKVEQM
jgi:hypothetical protein